MIHRRPCVFLLPGILALTACSNHDRRTAAVTPAPEEFRVVATVPPGPATRYLNDPVQWVFSAGVDLATASLATVRFAVFDSNTGDALAEEVSGSFRYGRRGGTEDQTVLEFRPRMPGRAPYLDGGLRPRRRYEVSLLQGADQPAVRALDGRRLRSAVPLRFFTPDGTTAAALFRNPAPGGPRLLEFLVVPTLQPATGTEPTVVPLGRLADGGVEVRLRFDQALDPDESNLPQRQSTDPLRRAERRRGPVYLLYDDPEFGNGHWIPTANLLERNDETGAEVVLVPDGVLPNHAMIRVMVEPFLADIAGENNGSQAGYQRLAGWLQTEDAWASQYDAVRLDFARPDLLDPDAVFLDPPARQEHGGLRAALAFEGSATQLDLLAGSGETLLNTDTVSGGVFQFRHVTVPIGAVVRGVGSNPLVILASGDVRVDGRLTANGGNGARVETLAAVPAAGGVGVCTGGNGGRGSPETTRSSLVGETGFGAWQQPGLGGQGGQIACGGAGIKRGSGGAGGSHATQGDPLYNDGAPFGGTNWVQPGGTGGWGYTNGSNTVNLRGGAAGPARGRDGNTANDFHGSTVDLFRRVRVTGEFSALAGGAGGGGGGNKSSGVACQSGPVNFINDSHAGGGGGGAGVLVVKALGNLTVGPMGLIAASGGHGGGGEFRGSNNEAGGGGGGAGGLVVLMAGSGIHLHRHGGTYQGPIRDYAFSVSADGGASLRGDFAGNPILDKYPVGDRATGTDTNSGGFGGMGVVQLMAPPGGNQDGTNTVLDDNVHIVDTDGVTRLTGGEKQRYLAWAGMGGRDDQGNVVPDYGGGGDIRPRPLLIPPTFGRYSRARTRWLPTGATVRRELTSPDQFARGLVTVPPDLVAGPDYSFRGTLAAGSGEDGYLAYDRATGQVQPPVLHAGLAIAALEPLGGEHHGRAVHRVTLVGDPLGAPAHRLSNLRLWLRDAFTTRIASFRIVGHSGSEVLLDPADGALPENAVRADVVAELVQVWTGQERGLGPTWPAGGGRLPIANVRIGFAFHRDPATPDLRTPGLDARRYPQALDTFVYDLNSPAVRSAVRDLHASFVQIDARFSLDYTDQSPDLNAGGNLRDGSAPRIELRELTLPYRF